MSVTVAKPIKLFYYMFYPMIILFNGSFNSFTRFISIPPASEVPNVMEEEEIISILSDPGKEGTVDLK